MFMRLDIICYLAALFLIWGSCNIVRKRYDALQQKITDRREQLAPPKGKVESYVARFSKVALSEQEKYGIPASIILAQGILESGVGRSKLAADYNNHFGIKCWCKGKRKDCVPMADDRPNDRFKRYKTAWESFRDHSKFLQSNKYRHLRHKGYREYAKGLKASGYATKRSYAHDLIAVVERYNLNRFDNL
jgi:flagellum-specific peptidoglycan hydrolase FlgJ